jgi:hypothetical protein
VKCEIPARGSVRTQTQAVPRAAQRTPCRADSAAQSAPTERRPFCRGLASASRSFGTGRYCPATFASALAAAGLCTSLYALSTATADGAAYAARAARDRSTHADVVDWEVTSHDDDDGSRYTTDVLVQYTAGTEQVRTWLSRPGEDDHESEVIDIVYDSANPLDADFGDRPNRRANDASVEVRRYGGTSGAIVSSAGIIVVAAAAAWRSRRTLVPSP